MKNFNILLITTLFFSLISLTGCETDPESTSTDFELSSTEILLDVAGTVQPLNITTGYSWALDVPESADWLYVSKTSGSGKGVILFSAEPLQGREYKEPAQIRITYNGTQAVDIVVRQTPDNREPSASRPVSPGDNAREISLYTSLEWLTSRDPDGDRVIYTIHLSEDNQTWEEHATNLNTNRYGFTQPLKKSTTYYWKVTSSDIFGASSESEVYSFTTTASGGYSEGETRVVQNSTSAAVYPTHLIFVGDGFIEEDYQYGGVFDSIVDAATEAYFNIEPYRSYREYFRVSSVAAHSQERGGTIRQKFAIGGMGPMTRNTAFSSVLEGGESTGIGCDYDKVLDYAMKVPGVTESDLRNTTVIVLINLDVYAGTCMMSYYGESVSMCPIGEYMVSIVNHEAGGHGFGRLADEYRYYQGQIPDQDIKDFRLWRNDDPWSFGANVDFTNDASQCHWNHYLDREDYAVGFFQGASYYYYGAWRPEQISCMEDNRPYFNAPSREAIVRRIMKGAGEKFDLEKFLAKDVQKTDPSTRAYENAMPRLAPPVMRK